MSNQPNSLSGDSKNTPVPEGMTDEGVTRALVAWFDIHDEAVNTQHYRLYENRMRAALIASGLVVENDKLRSMFAWDREPGLPDVPVLQPRYDALKAELSFLRERLAAAEKDAARLDSGVIRIQDRDEFGEPYGRLFVGLNLREAIDAGRREQGEV